VNQLILKAAERPAALAHKRKMKLETVYECVQSFRGARSKGAPFRGWAGSVIEWPSNDAPRIAFGTWIPEVESRYNGGVVRFQCRPLALVMFGANSKEMRVKDKTTHFGFAGLAPGGRLCVAQLPVGIDARQIFSAGGWSPPNVNELTAGLVSLTQNGETTSSELSNLIASTEKALLDGFGIYRGGLIETLDSWPILAPIHAALDAATLALRILRDKSKMERYRQAVAEVNVAIAALQAVGSDITLNAIAAVLVNETDPAAHVVKDKVRKLKRTLGNDLGGLVLTHSEQSSTSD
jgi:hypothetical protein